MANTTQCGDRRCTLEGADQLVRAYREGYTVYVGKLTKSQIDGLDPSMTRIKTEIDEIHELIESAKKKGASAWEGVKDTVQTALDRLGESYHAVIHDGPK